MSEVVSSRTVDAITHEILKGNDFNQLVHFYVGRLANQKQIQFEEGLERIVRHAIHSRLIVMDPANSPWADTYLLGVNDGFDNGYDQGRKSGYEKAVSELSVEKNEGEA